MNVVEDSVVEHDARRAPGFGMVGGGVTGRPVFRNGAEVLEGNAANHRPLEQVSGVDLIPLKGRPRDRDRLGPRQRHAGTGSAAGGEGAVPDARAGLATAL